MALLRRCSAAAAAAVTSSHARSHLLLCGGTGIGRRAVVARLNATVTGGDGATRTPAQAAPAAVRTPGMHQSPIVAKLWAQRVSQTDGGAGGSNSKPAGPATPSSTAQKVVYEFTKDPVLVDKYANPWGTFRIGRILEDLDALAGNIATQHCTDASGYCPTLVTASVDRITVRHPPNLKSDMTLSGHVAWTGKSSLVISMQAMALDQSEPWIRAHFTFVARSPEGAGAASVPQVEAQSAEEISEFHRCQRRHESRKKARAAAEATGGEMLGWPNVESMKVAQDLLARARNLIDLPCLRGSHHVLLPDTSESNALICQPQHRNMRGHVFGGFLMRRAYELGFATAYLFCGSTPVFLEVDEVVFRRPVMVGNLLRLKSAVLYTGVHELHPSVHVEVMAWVTRPEDTVSELSNVFNFTFIVKDASNCLPQVLPTSLEEARRVVSRIAADKAQAAEDARHTAVAT